MTVTCKHLKLHVVYLSNENGSAQLEICSNVRCAHIVRSLCEHTKNTWKYTRNEADPDEQYLSCDLCGADGT